MHWRRAFLALLAVMSLLAAVDDEAFIGKRRNYWAFRKPVRPEVPALGSAWVRTPIDAFLLEAMRQKQVEPSPALDRARLLRRVTLDLTGLPPTPSELASFRQDRAPDAYERVVDRLLASPHYGERWALRWLDVARYADTNGYEIDAERPQAWRYRDYVVRAFNSDKPYDRFVKEQIAGDELWPGDHDALIATGFHRAGPIHLVSGNQDVEMNRQEVLTEYAGGIASAFLGLTVGCARCHNHKFDPILQADYYRLQAVFAATEGKDVDIASAVEKASYQDAKKAYETRLAPLQEQIAAIEKPYREQIKAEKTRVLEARYREVLAIPEAQLTPEQKTLAKDAKTQIAASWDEVVNRLSADDKARRAGLRAQMHRIELTEPDPPPTAYAVTNMAEAPPTYILKVGDYRNKLGVVEPGVVTVLNGSGVEIPMSSSGRRAAFANWLASDQHPLTARVIVNRIWQFRMGSGLVATPNDFGLLGQRPSNQKLLDWLAVEFVEKGWSVKGIDRMIVLSNAYQQAVAEVPASAKVDPENKLYWRMNRKRLEGETIRDCVLAVAGDFNPKMGGPPVRVPIEKEVYDLIFSEAEPDNLWPLPQDTSEFNRRSLYLLNKRTVRLPLLMNFDQPDTMTSCQVRPTSTHALQALSLMNGDFMQGQSAQFAKRLEADCRGKRACEVDRAYELALMRRPGPREKAMANGFFAKGGLLADFCLALLNRNEFVYLP
jgi:hypothetical protein